jgi:hypothetical protein
MSKFIKEVCEILDVTVLSDLGEKDGVVYTENSQPSDYKPVYALGWNSEPGAGIRYGTVTRWFDSEVKLEQWCERNIEKIRNLSDMTDEPVPDMEGWE